MGREEEGAHAKNTSLKIVLALKRENVAGSSVSFFHPNGTKSTPKENFNHETHQVAQRKYSKQYQTEISYSETARRNRSRRFFRQQMLFMK